MDKKKVNIQVCYASKNSYQLIDLNLKNANILEAIYKSGILFRFPEINLKFNRVGVFGKLKDLRYILNNNDRVEIYRSLQIGPMELRRLRERKNKQKNI
tara:strand:- start:200 stop:496 length:297 start_codon:yes stop_codon:yes gene_type:complete